MNSSVTADHPGMDQKTVGLLSGQKMAFFDQGLGPAIVILHGAPGSSLSLVPLARDLANEDHRVITPDLLGFGASSFTEDIFELWADHQAEAVMQMLRSLQIQNAILIGHDFGAFISLILQQRAPDIVSKMVLVNCNPFTGTPPPFPLSIGTWPGVGELYLRYQLSTTGLRSLVNNSLGTNRSIVNYEELAGHKNQRTATQKILRKMILGFGHKSARIEESLQHLTVPTQFIFGALDPMIPQTVHRQLAQTFAPDQIIVSKNSGHWIPYENRAELIRITLEI